MVQEKGVKNTLAFVEKLGSAHLEDDLHRVLVQYILKGLPAKGLVRKGELWRSLNMTLYEVSLSEHDGDDEQKQVQDLEKLLSSMEQFYAGMLSIASGGTVTSNIFSVEVAVEQGSEEAIFYVSVPTNKKELFERHLISIFPNAKLEERRSDYNIFKYGGVHGGMYGKLARHPVYPMKTYEEFNHDPLNVILSAFSKLRKHGEGAAIQFIIGDNKDAYNKQYKNVIDKLRKGNSAGKAVARGTSVFRNVVGDFGDTLKEALFGASSGGDKPVDQLVMDIITKKVTSRIVPVNLRLVASAEEKERVDDILESMSSTFNQLEEAQGNKLTFTPQEGRKWKTFLNHFIFRTMDQKWIMPFSLKELTTMYHLTATAVSTSRELKKSRAKGVAAPIEVSDVAAEGLPGTPSQQNTDSTPSIDTQSQVSGNTEHTSAPIRAEVSTPPGDVGQVPQTPLQSSDQKTLPEQPTAQELMKKGVILGKNVFGGTDTIVYFKNEDRLRHFYEIGQTGTGKSYAMKRMIMQDIQNGDGCCYIDPHGADIADILASVPRERWDDVIYFDPAHLDRPYALNMYEYDPSAPEQKTFVVNEMFSIFEKLFGDVPESMGPMFQQYFRNASLLVVDDPHNPGTLADVPRVMADKAFRDELLAKNSNPLVKQFWKSAEATSGEQSLENFVPYITSKTDIFLSNDFIRPIVAQQYSSMDFRKIMDERKILLCDLSKGRIGDLNAELLGMIIVGKFLLSALARVDTPDEKRYPFYLYIDEFQNFTTPSISTILSEARKYRLSLNLAHQYISQLDDKIKDSVFGNVGSKMIFRVGAEDAEFLEKTLKPEFSAADIVGLDNMNAYMALLVDGKPVRPFNMTTDLRSNPDLLPHEAHLDHSNNDIIKQMSFEKYGRPRKEVEEEIMGKYMKKAMKEQPVPDAFGGLGF